MEKTWFAPAETARHAATWMCWPADAAIYGGPGAYYEAVRENLGKLAAAIAEHEPVFLAAGAEHHELAAELCGPKVLTDGQGGLAARDFNFNGWGGKQHHGRDEAIAAAMAAHAGCVHLPSGLTGEGGGLEYDGEGTLLLTESCWVNDNRNPGKSRAEIEAALKADLGVEKVIWLLGTAGEDITDGHIDGLARIARPGVVVTSSAEGDPDDPWNAPIAEAAALLARETDARGRAFEVVDIPCPDTVRSDREDFEIGYVNYYVGNGAVYLPEFGDPRSDGFAQETFARLFPGRKVVALNVDRIQENGGGIHCVTQQQPAV
jgi:agmatine deiminase